MTNILSRVLISIIGDSQAAFVSGFPIHDHILLAYELIKGGDPTSIKLVMQKFNEFSQATGLKVNPNKCKVYFGNVEPSDQQVIKDVEVVCKTFLWAESEKISRKSPIAWNNVCTPRKQGGLNITSLGEWNKANLMKLLWNLNV
ncbi:hypothetical protein KIW84_051406 [Lathyrus oleraceus]|uniref:Reverse transcriptase domain-containing protein n=1 Tax=Pisum sativum TaxID=3888 RepID=A0A9D5AFX1_PEA|nr:hypothetical protein KIW84_051406 [Pisum sativum]